MPNPKKKNHQSDGPLSEARLEELLSGQTTVILEAVYERLGVQEVKILAGVDKRLEKLEKRWLEKFNQLTTTLDKFLKRLTDFEEVFKFLKEDLKHVKAVIREKLGVSLDQFGLSTGPYFWRPPSRGGLLGSSPGAIRVLTTRVKKWRGFLGVEHKQV